MNKQMWKKYTEQFGIRFMKGDKKRFANEIEKDFKELGMDTEVSINRKGFGKVINIYVGNVKQAKKILLIPYDTPARIFWHKNDIYPQNGYLNTKKSFVPVYVPLLIMYAILLLLAYLPPVILPSVFTPMVMSVLTIWLFVFMFFAIIKGFPNFNNAVRNSASVVMGYDVVSSLSKEQRKDVLIVFTDCKKRYYGNAFVDQYLIEHNKRNLPVIGLYCIGRGKDISIIADKGTKSIARNIAKQCGNNCRVSSVDDLKKEETAIQFLKNAMLICTGDIDENNELVVKDTALAKDNKINEEICDKIVNAVKLNIVNKK